MAADRSRAARNRNARSSAAKVERSSLSNRSSRWPKDSSDHAGAGAAVVAVLDSRAEGKAQARSRALHRVRISLARRDRPSNRGRDRPRLHQFEDFG